MNVYEHKSCLIINVGWKKILIALYSVLLSDEKS